MFKFEDKKIEGFFFVLRLVKSSVWLWIGVSAKIVFSHRVWVNTDFFSTHDDV